MYRWNQFFVHCHFENPCQADSAWQVLVDRPALFLSHCLVDIIKTTLPIPPLSSFTLPCHTGSSRGGKSRVVLGVMVDPGNGLIIQKDTRGHRKKHTSFFLSNSERLNGVFTAGGWETKGRPCLERWEGWGEDQPYSSHRIQSKIRPQVFLKHCCSPNTTWSILDKYCFCLVSLFCELQTE